VLRIGLISDTHGLLRPQALDYLQGSAHIVHAGDIGAAAILDALAAIAPVTAVRGNNDTGDWAQPLPHSAQLQIEGLRILVVHDLADLARLGIDLQRDGIAALVTGHSHQPLITQRDGAVHVNPGSAGRRRFTLPVSVGELLIARGQVTARLHTLQGL
jgi:putative phosphoesterase